MSTEDIWLAAGREEIARVHSKGVYEIVPMRECKDAGEKTLGSDLGGQTSLWTTTHKNIRSRLCAREHKTKRQGQQFTIEVETLRHQQSAFTKEQSRDSYIRASSSGRSTEIWLRPSWLIDQERARNSACFTHQAT